MAEIDTEKAPLVKQCRKRGCRNPVYYEGRCYHHAAEANRLPRAPIPGEEEQPPFNTSPEAAALRGAAMDFAKLRGWPVDLEDREGQRRNARLLAAAIAYARIVGGENTDEIQKEACNRRSRTVVPRPHCHRSGASTRTRP